LRETEKEREREKEKKKDLIERDRVGLMGRAGGHPSTLDPPL